jgi:hypothetical protein
MFLQVALSNHQTSSPGTAVEHAEHDAVKGEEVDDPVPLESVLCTAKVGCSQARLHTQMWLFYERVSAVYAWCVCGRSHAAAAIICSARST